jgi:glutathione S-transferase
MFKLYYGTGTCALASHITLAEAGAEYEAVRLNFRSNDQTTPDYLAINPKARVPALATPQGVLTETPAILAFIAQTFPAARLAPLDDPFAFGQVQAFNNYLCATVHVAHAHRSRGYRWADDPAAIAEMTRKVPENMAACFALIERTMFRGPWVMGESYTICDPYVFTVGRWLEGDNVDLASLPKILEHRRRMEERAAVKQVLATETGEVAPQNAFSSRLM